MRQPGVKFRWVLSPLETVAGGARLPVCREYALHTHAPMELGGNVSLCHCAMLSSQLAAAQKDPRLIVLESLHSRAPIPAALAANLAAYGVLDAMTVHEVLTTMAAHHLDFLPEH